MMNREELLDLYDELKKLERHLKRHGAPRAIVARAHDALGAVNWEIDRQGE